MYQFHSSWLVYDEQVIYFTVITAYFTIAAMAIWVWDWVVNFEDELEYIWRRGWNMGAGKPLYLFIKYGGLAYQAYDLAEIVGNNWGAEFCTVYYYTIPAANTGFQMIVDLLLAYRITCLYMMNKYLLYTNLFLFAGSVAGVISCVVIAFSGVEGIQTPPYILGCWGSVGDTAFLCLIPPTVYKFWLVGLLFYNIWSRSRLDGAYGSKILIRMIMRDSMTWIFVMCGAVFWNFAQMMWGPRGLKGIALPLLRVFINIGGCRLILHMRKEIYPADNDEDSQLTTVKFRTRANAPQGVSVFDLRTQDLFLTIGERIGLPPVTKWQDTEFGVPVELVELPEEGMVQEDEPTAKDDEESQRNTEPTVPPGIATIHFAGLPIISDDVLPALTKDNEFTVL